MRLSTLMPAAFRRATSSLISLSKAVCSDYCSFCGIKFEGSHPIADEVEEGFNAGVKESDRK